MTTRSGWKKNDYLLSIKSGVNNRNHGKLDAGALALAYGGQWLLTAPRYGTGKRDGTGGYWDLSGRRWTYFSCATESHSTLLVNGANQRFDRKARGTIDTFVSEGDWCWTGVDLTQAYAGVKSARREVLHRRGDYILVFDDVKLAKPGSVEWLAQVQTGGKADGGQVEVTGTAGTLRVRVLFPPDAVFLPRKADSPHYDVPTDRLKTFALMRRGAEVRYVVALLPTPIGQTSRVGVADVEETSDGFAVIIHGEGWTDKITVDASRVRAVRTAADGQIAEFSTGRHRQ